MWMTKLSLGKQYIFLLGPNIKEKKLELTVWEHEASFSPEYFPAHRIVDRADRYFTGECPITTWTTVSSDNWNFFRNNSYSRHHSVRCQSLGYLIQMVLSVGMKLNLLSSLYNVLSISARQWQVQTSLDWLRLNQTSSDWPKLVLTGLNWIDLNWFRAVRTGLDWFEPAQTGIDRLKQVRTSLDQFRVVWNGLNQLMPVYTGSDQFEPV